MSTSTSTSTPKKVLLLGVHMNAGEPLSEPQLLSMLDGSVSGGREHRLDISYHLTSSSAPDHADILAKLRSQTWDIVAVGPGVRFPKERSALFEWCVNAVVRVARAPGGGVPLLVFNDSPAGVVQACIRGAEEGGRLDGLVQG